MLVPNKHSGYQYGRRIYPVGGGIGEAMLLGAAMGGGSAALTGGDPLKGALLGGLTGGAGAGIGGALGGATAGTEAALTDAATQAATQAGTQAGTQGANYALTSGTSAAPSLNLSAMNSGIPVDYSLNAPSVFPGASSSMYSLGGGPATFPGAETGIAPLASTATAPTTGGTFTQGMQRFADDPIASIQRHKFLAGASGLAGAMGTRSDPYSPEEYKGPLSKWRYNPDAYRPSWYAEGGITTLASGGYDRQVGEEPMYQANMASGGISSLGGYSDGGRMLRGPGDGVSDSIPAVIGGRRPARLADGEFVVPARIVSELGNGSTDAGARELYKMMGRVQEGRRKTIGKDKVAVDSKARKLLPV